MVTSRSAASGEGIVTLAKAVRQAPSKSSNGDIKDPRDLPFSKLPHSAAKHHPQPNLPLAEACSDNSDQLSATLRIDGRGRFLVESSPCLVDSLESIYPPDFVNNFIDVALLKQQNIGSAQNASQQSQSPNGWRSIENFKAHRLRVAKHSAKRGRHSSSHTPAPIKQRRSSTEAQSYPRFSEAIQDSAEDEPSEDDNFVDTANEFRSIKVGDVGAVRNAYYEIFDHMQQIPCKHIAKAWIKVREPKKQSQFPYNGGKYKAKSEAMFGEGHGGWLKRPWWWLHDRELCPHTEPDHIKKHHRLNLLIHMLRGTGLMCKELEESTNEMMSTIDTNPERSVKPLLDEIYHIRRQEEAFFRGEIDADAIISVKIRVKSKPSQLRKPAKKPAKSNNAGKSNFKRSASESNQTPEAPISSHRVSPLLSRMNVHVKEQRREQGFPGIETTLLPTKVTDQPLRHDADARLSYKPTDGTSIVPSSFAVNDAQDTQAQPGAPTLVVPQTDGLQQDSTQTDMKRGLQYPSSRRSAVHSQPIGSVPFDFDQQVVAVKIERPPPSCHDPVPPLSVPNVACDELGYNQQSATDRSWSYPTVQLQSGLLAGYRMLENGLPTMRSQYPLDSQEGVMRNGFSAASINDTFAPALNFTSDLSYDELAEENGYYESGSYP